MKVIQVYVLATIIGVLGGLGYWAWEENQVLREELQATADERDSCEALEGIYKGTLSELNDPKGQLYWSNQYDKWRADNERKDK